MKLVCFIASVIQDARRLEFFRMLLDSIRAQENPCTGLFISIYINPALLNPHELGSLFQGLPNVYVLRQKRPKVQFAQYKEMMDRFEKRFPQGADFILFSDDDDLWHPKRVRAYRDCFGYIHDKVSAIIIKEETRVDETRRTCACLSGNSVEAMMECGCVTFKFPCMQTEEQIRGFTTEYHECAVRPYVLRDFLENNVSLVMYNRFADMEFRQFIWCYRSVDEFITINLVPPHWIYFYRRLDPTYKCVTNPVEFQVTAREQLTKDTMKNLINYVADMIVSGDAMRAVGQKQLLHYAEVFGPDKSEEFQNMAQKTLSEKHLQICVNDPVWQRKMRAMFPTMANGENWNMAYVWWMACRHEIVNAFMKRTDILAADKWYACLPGEYMEGPFETRQLAEMAGQSMLEKYAELPELCLAHTYMVLKKDEAPLLLYSRS